jgi:hypothetical protein
MHRTLKPTLDLLAYNFDAKDLVCFHYNTEQIMLKIEEEYAANAIDVSLAM